jgi:hypothetical protein
VFDELNMSDFLWRNGSALRDTPAIERGPSLRRSLFCSRISYFVSEGFALPVLAHTHGIASLALFLLRERIRLRFKTETARSAGEFRKR